MGSYKCSLKFILLNNTNKRASTPIGYSATLKEKYDPIKQVMEQIKYVNDNWVICMDLKMVNFLQGQRSRYKKFPCFL